MKVAIVHEWLVTHAGSESVLEQILQCFPEADLFCLVDFLPEAQRGFLGNRPVRTSFIQKLPRARQSFRTYLPLMPLAIEQFDVTGYDLVISSSHAVAKGIITGPDQLHVCYCHTPIRYAWDLQHQYLNETGLSSGIKGWLAKAMLHRIRTWDTRTANGVDVFLANSEFTRRRIWRVYRRDSTVVYPPVDTTFYNPRDEKEDFYLAASRMVPYKKMDLVVEAFGAMPDKQLVVIGTGPEEEKVRSRCGANVRFLGYQSREVLRDYMQRAKAFVFAAKEDFGIIPVEAQACGTPVIAFGQGGAAETVAAHTSSRTGVLFGEQTRAALINAVHEFERDPRAFSPVACRRNAERFSAAAFRRRLAVELQRALEKSGRVNHKAGMIREHVPARTD